jgi:isocitrate dehydrogenase kinase/phosphatase
VVSVTETAPAEYAYARIVACTDEGQKITATADLILAVFDDFYAQFCEYPYRAKRAFEAMDPHASIRISRERLGLYSRYIEEHGPRILAAFPALSDNAALWDAIDRLLLAMIADRYEADIIFGFTHSLRRNIDHGIWRPVAYAFPPPSERRVDSMAHVHRRLPLRGRVDSALLTQALQIPGFSVPFRDLKGDARRILQRLEQLLYCAPEAPLPVALDVVAAGFFRDRTAFLVGRWVMTDATYVPFVVAFLNSPAGIQVDAVLHQVADIHGLFSSALANFHVTTRLYYQTCVFLFSLMPRRPLGHHYATIGFNHVGKVVILKEIIDQSRATGERLRRSPGFPGTVALGFSFESCSYHLKVIRDRPTASYKWGDFPGITAVVDKYRHVHEMNRAASMLDNVMYFNVRLDKDLFEPELLEEIFQQAPGSVQFDGDGLFFRFLIVQLRIVPLPVYLEQANESETHAVIRSLGHCIRNNAATNIFNKDLDSRNYGVGRYGRVFLFDYDAVEKLTAVKIRTNLGREPGEEMPPDWFYEEGVIFLPEELEHGLQLKSNIARRSFRRQNADLLTAQYWEEIQQKLQRGEVPELRRYPRATKLPPLAKVAPE